MRDKSTANNILVKPSIQYLFFIVNCLLLHLYTYDFIGDDIITTDYLTPTLGSQFFHLWDGTVGWSSRVLINPLIYIMLHFDYHVWILCNVAILFAIYVSLAYILGAKGFPYNVLWLLIMLMYPLDASVNYGMVVMSMTYLWPAAAGCVALFVIKKHISGKKIPLLWWILLPVCTLYASNKEELSVTLAIIFGAFFVYTIRRHRICILAGIQFAISFFSILSHYFSTSNHNRFEQMSEHISYTFFDKAEIGVTSTFFYLFCRFDFIALLFFCVLGIVSWKKVKKPIHRAFSLCPFLLWLIMSLIWYRNPKSINDTDYAISYGKYNDSREIILGILYIVASIIVIWALYTASICIKQFINMLILFLSGFIGRCVVGFGNKGWMTSFERTYTFFYLILMALMYSLLKPYITDWIKCRKRIAVLIGCLLVVISDIRIVIHLMWL